MTVILVGRRGSDGTPLVLVRCDCCHFVGWLLRDLVKHKDITVYCPCGTSGHVEVRQPTLAQADREREGASDAA